VSEEGSLADRAQEVLVLEERNQMFLEAIPVGAAINRLGLIAVPRT
jgi:hypothetical protein